MSAILDLFRSEPTVVIGVLGTLGTGVLELAISFGVPITADQKTAVQLIAGAVGSLITLYAIRSQVTPVAKLGIAPAADGPKAATP